MAQKEPRILHIIRLILSHRYPQDGLGEIFYEYLGEYKRDYENFHFLQNSGSFMNIWVDFDSKSNIGNWNFQTICGVF